MEVPGREATYCLMRETPASRPGASPDTPPPGGWEAGRAGREANARVRHIKAIPVEAVTGGTSTVRQVLTGPGGGSGFHMRRFVMEPGGGMPRHQNVVEHQQFVLRGAATVGIGEEVYHVHAGDVVHIPGGTPHWYRAEGGVPFEFLCVVPDDDDRIQILGDAPAR